MYVHFHGCQRHVRDLEAIRSNLIYIITPQINTKYCVFNSWMILALNYLVKIQLCYSSCRWVCSTDNTIGRELLLLGAVMKNPFAACSPGGVIADLLVPRGVYHTRTWLTATRHSPGTFFKSEESPAFAHVYAEIIGILWVQELFQLMEWIGLDYALL